MARKLLITGAAGGMGRACARLLGATHNLILTDAANAPLQDFAAELAADGYAIAGIHAGHLGDPSLLRDLVAPLQDGEPFALLHTAGLSPSMADWRAIMEVNLVATEQLLRAVEAHLVPGSVAVLIASAAGYVPSEVPGSHEILAAPLAGDFIERIGELMSAATGGDLRAAAGLSYMLGKREVLAIVERRAAAWGAKGARIVSISPGLIRTPMGRTEIAGSAAARAQDEASAVGRSGRAIDIAMAARFLLSEEASFITGSDLKVDGGSIAAMRDANFG